MFHVATTLWHFCRNNTGTSFYLTSVSRHFAINSVNLESPTNSLAHSYAGYHRGPSWVTCSCCEHVSNERILDCFQKDSTTANTCLYLFRECFGVRLLSRGLWGLLVCQIWILAAFTCLGMLKDNVMNMMMMMMMILTQKTFEKRNLGFSVFSFVSRSSLCNEEWVCCVDVCLWAKGQHIQLLL